MFAHRMRRELQELQPIASSEATYGYYYYHRNHQDAIIPEIVTSEFDIPQADDDDDDFDRRLRGLRLRNVSAMGTVSAMGNESQATWPLYGSVEVISRSALQKFFDSGACEKLSRERLGEDRVMGTCLNELGTRQLQDKSIVADQYCGAPGGCSEHRPAYHPLKSVNEWVSCWENASLTE